MNGWLLVRIAGICVGIATLLRVATNEGIVTYDPLFLAWMDRLRDIVELGFLTDLIGPFLHWGIDWVRSFGIGVPGLQDHWRPMFVLIWLLSASVARNQKIGLSTLGALSLAILFALTVSVTTGMLASDNVAIVTWPVFAFAAVVCVYFLISAVRNNDLGRLIVTLFWLFWLLLHAAIPGGLAGQVAIPAIAILVFVGAFVSLAMGLLGGKGSFLERLQHPLVRTGLDVTSTMLGALFIASLAAKPPIW
jgi:hypothetical protein